jgi:hypothetical protein
VDLEAQEQAAAVHEAAHDLVDVDNEWAELSDDGPDLGDDAPKANTNGPSIRLYSVEELDGLPEPEWLVEDHISGGAVGVFYGKSGSFKSFTVLNIALCVTHGRKFLGKHPTKRAPVVYLSGEGQGSIKYRIRAWHQHHGLPPTTRLQIVPLAFSLKDRELRDDLLRAITDWDRPGLIVVDTLSKYFGSGSESKDQDMRPFMDALFRLRDKTGAAVVVVHHTGKDVAKGERGHSLLRADSDFSVFAKRDEDTRQRVAVEKQKDTEELKPYMLERHVVTLEGRYDRAGKPITSLVFECPAEDPGTPGPGSPTPRGTKKKNAEAVAAAEVWLRGQLQQQGPHMATRLYETGQTQGHTKPAIQKAGEILKVEKKNEGGAWRWWLPEPPPKPPCEA